MFKVLTARATIIRPDATTGDCELIAGHALRAWTAALGPGSLRAKVYHLSGKFRVDGIILPIAEEKCLGIPHTP